MAEYTIQTLAGSGPGARGPGIVHAWQGLVGEAHAGCPREKAVHDIHFG